MLAELVWAVAALYAVFTLTDSGQQHDSGRLGIAPNTHQSISGVAKASRIIREYGGVLPCAGGRARHLLRCEHLRQLPGERFPPFRVEPNYTHQFWLWYRLDEQPDRLILVFRGQFELTLLGRDADEVALEVTDFMADYLSKVEDFSRVTRHDNSDLFWATLIETKVASLKAGQGKILL